MSKEVLKTQTEIAILLKSHIDNLDDRYQSEMLKATATESRLIISDTIEVELQAIAISISKLESARVITVEHYLSCMVLLAEVKSNFLKLVA